MASRTTVLARAASQIGTVESPWNSNRTKYGAWYGFNGVAWCDIFVSWVFGTTGASSLIGGKFAYCPSHMAWFRARGQLRSTPLAGDIVFFSWYGGVPDHVGIVEKVFSNGTIQTIEGNTSSNNRGSQNNGGGVYRRIRSSKTYIAGYGRPKYTTTPPPPKGHRNIPMVKNIQTALHLPADGQWGVVTNNAARLVIQKKIRTTANIKYIQARIGTKVDGQWGPVSNAYWLLTMKRLQKALGVRVTGTWNAQTNNAWNYARKNNYMNF